MNTFERRWRLMEILCPGPQVRETLLERLIGIEAQSFRAMRRMTASGGLVRVLGLGFI